MPYPKLSDRMDDMDTETLNAAQIEILNAWLAEVGYETVQEWAEESDYRLVTDVGWVDENDNLVDIEIQAWWAMMAEADYSVQCPVCGSPIDFCQGHGEVGDPNGFRILQKHDADDHSECDEDGCYHATKLRTQK